jgi:hypothetical protein
MKKEKKVYPLFLSFNPRKGLAKKQRNEPPMSAQKLPPDIPINKRRSNVYM